MTRNCLPVPYKVVGKKGNAVFTQAQEGNTKLRNGSHMKRFIQPDNSTEATRAHAGDKAEDMPFGRQLGATCAL